MISKSNVRSVPCDGVFVVIYFKTMYNKKKLLDSVFVISGLIKVSENVISRAECRG